MDWITDFRVLPGGCMMGPLALATSPVARDTERALCQSVARRVKGKRTLSAKLLFDLWVLGHYETPTSREAIGAAVPKILSAQSRGGQWRVKPYLGRSSPSQMISATFRDPLCTTYRVLETLHLAGLLSELIRAGRLRNDPLELFRTREDTGGLVARRDFEHRTPKRDDGLSREWITAILRDQAQDGSWQKSVVLTAHALLLLADLRADETKQVKHGLKWLRRQFRSKATLPAYDAISRQANPVVCTFGAATDPLAEAQIWARITGEGWQQQGQEPCWRRIGGAQSALCVRALNRWHMGRCPEAQAWVVQTRIVGQLCGNFTSRVFLHIRHRAGQVELTPRQLKTCSRPDVTAAAERLRAARPDLPR